MRTSTDYLTDIIASATADTSLNFVFTGVLQDQNRRQVKISEIDSQDFATFVDLVCAELVDMDIDLYLERWTNGDATVETIQAAYQQQSFQWTNLHEAQHMKPFMEALKQTIAVPTELSMAPVTGMPALLDFLTKVLPFDIRGTSDVAFFARPPGMHQNQTSVLLFCTLREPQNAVGLARIYCR
jgi:hypothetical protein